MPSLLTAPSPLVSKPVYGLVASSDRLRSLLLPESVLEHPYEVLDYDGVLTLHDHKGLKATFKRRERVRFLQDGVGGMLEHLWGDGITVGFSNNAGMIGDTIRDAKARHLIVELKRSMAKGEELEFAVKRINMVGFTKSREWLETVVDHPISKLTRSVVFPSSRPCQEATLSWGGQAIALPIETLPDGRTLVRFRIARPQMNTSYLLNWSW